MKPHDYVIVRLGRSGARYYYRWSDDINDVIWDDTIKHATIWTNKRDARAVAVTVGGEVVARGAR